MPPTPPAAAGAPKCDFDRITTDAIAKITASTGNVQRSNACTKLCPKKARPVCSSTMMTSPSSGAKPNKVASA